MQKTRPTSADDPQHQATRAVLRMAGPAIAALGLVFVIVGVGNFFTSFGTFEPPRYFWCAFVGVPLLGVGLMVCQFAFLGTIFRYQTREMTPTMTEAFQDLAQGAAPGVRVLARAQATGLADGFGMRELDCPECDRPNPVEARYCNHCGATLAEAACGACGQTNPSGARFCNACGGKLTATP